MPDSVIDPNLQEDLNTYIGLRQCLHQWLISGAFWRLPEQFRRFVLLRLLQLRQRLRRMRRKIMRALAGGALAASLTVSVAARLHTPAALPPGGAPGVGVAQVIDVSSPLGSYENAPGRSDSPYMVPAFVDIDGDGDIDIFLRTREGTIRFFENTGTAAVLGLVEQTGTANPFDGVNVGRFSVFSFVDIDNDGDFDAIIRSDDGALRFFENTGDGTSLTFVERTGAANPFDGVNVGARAVPGFVDIDNDGGVDAFFGAGDGTLRFYRNTGGGAGPTFVEQTGAANPFDGVDVGRQRCPQLRGHR